MFILLKLCVNKKAVGSTARSNRIVNKIQRENNVLSLQTDICIFQTDKPISALQKPLLTQLIYIW
jgi:hypothetical protein